MKFVITSFLGALLLLCTSDPSQTEHAAHRQAWRRLLSLENQDLAKLDSKDSDGLLSCLLRVAPRSIHPFPFSDSHDLSPVHFPRYLWKVQNPDEPVRYVLIGADGLFTIPGDSRANACVFDLDGNLLSYTEFSLGWRSDFQSVSLISNDQFALPMIKFVMDKFDMETEQFYALTGNDLSLIRLEGKNGIVRNQFLGHNWEIGPQVPDRTPEQWENMLWSSNPAEVLRALTWIGWQLKLPAGVRSDVYTDPRPEVRKNAKPVAGVRLSPVVQQRLLELRDSGNKWIKEAAELALSLLDGNTSGVAATRESRDRRPDPKGRLKFLHLVSRQLAGCLILYPNRAQTWSGAFVSY